MKPAGLLGGRLHLGGNNPDGYDSAQCNWLGVGKGYVIPVPAGRSGTLTASIKLHTVAGFAGDAGFDIWLTGRSQHQAVRPDPVRR